MKNERIIINKTGGPEVLQLFDESMPNLHENKVRVRVLATAVAFADILMRKGKYPATPNTPFTPGHEVVGVVESIGENINSVKKGDLVAAFCKFGGYTKYIDLPEHYMVPIPDGVDPYEAAAIILNFLTAYQILYRESEINDSSSLLIHGAAGGVGSAFMQLINEKNLQVYATASRNNEASLPNGVRLIDYKKDDFIKIIQNESPRGVDFVFDGVGGFNWRKSYQVLKPTGIFIGYGLTFADNEQTNAEEHQFMKNELKRLVATNKTESGHNGKFYSISTVAKNNPGFIKEDLLILFHLLLEKKISPIIAEKIPLEKANEAHELFELGVNGKILLTPIW